MKTNCKTCEYEADCFPLLKFVQRVRDVCRQYRKKAARQSRLPVQE